MRFRFGACCWKAPMFSREKVYLLQVLLAAEKAILPVPWDIRHVYWELKHVTIT